MILVIGGHSRKIGKTSLVTAIIRRFADLEWNAVKVSKNSRNHGNTYSLREESVASEKCDTGRYLVAGARRAYWLRANDAQLPEAATELKKLLQSGGNWIIESNRILDYLEPDLYIQLVDPAVDDYKTSFVKYTGKADAVVVVARGERSLEEKLPPPVRLALQRLPVFRVVPLDYCPDQLAEFLEQSFRKIHSGRERDAKS